MLERLVFSSSNPYRDFPPVLERLFFSGKNPCTAYRENDGSLALKKKIRCLKVVIRTPAPRVGKNIFLALGTVVGITTFICNSIGVLSVMKFSEEE